jgi:DNA-binding NtrC family response regulator
MVFVVEDDQSVREALTSLIRSGGWNTEVFLSAERRTPVVYQRPIRLYTKVQLATCPVRRTVAQPVRQTPHHCF